MDPNQQLYIDILNRIPIDRIQDHPNILVAAGFWEEERYRAAKTCYSFMRSIDDLIDDYKSAHKHIDEQDREKFIRKVNDWVQSIHAGRRPGLLQHDLISAIRKFRIPSWPIENFARSMVYDIYNDGFPTIQSFLEYSEGATVAPSSIFVHLCGISKRDSIWQDPLYNVKATSTPCAIFSYLVHIIRDFQKDQLNNLSYFADDRILANDLTRSQMRQIAEGAGITAGFRNLMGEYYQMADEYRAQTWQVLDRISGQVEPRYYLSLHIIFNLYLMVFERIDVDNGSFTAKELNPSPKEIHDRVYRTIMEFQYHSVNY
ncbi:MAG: squalene/phytoene synthase family protein [Bacteroidales bacterium]|jgi:phytoene/squalene synthetase